MNFSSQRRRSTSKGRRAVLALEGLQAEVHGGDVRLEIARPSEGRRTVFALEGLQAKVYGIVVRLACAAAAEEVAELDAWVARGDQVRRRVVHLVGVPVGDDGRGGGLETRALCGARRRG